MSSFSSYSYFNGKIVPSSEAKISIFTPAMRYAATVFEGIRAYWNETEKQLYVFRLREHCERLLESMKMMGMDEHSFTREDLEEAVFSLIKKENCREDIHVLQMVFVDGIGEVHATSPAKMGIGLRRRERMAESFDAGLHVNISSWSRIADNSMPARIKCTANYHNGRLAMIEAKKNGYHNTIILNQRGKVSETPGACVFLSRKGVLSTPSITSDILESITRDTVLKLWEDYSGVKILERDVDRTELYVSDEVFICGTAYEITPVTYIDKMPVGNGKVGPLTKKLQDLYFDICKGINKEHMEWRAAVYSI